MVEDKASSWGCRACSTAVVGSEDRREGVRGTASASDLQKGPHNSPHHAMHKSVRCDLEAPVASSRVGDPLSPFNAADAVRGLRAGPAERGKIVLAEQVLGRGVHRIEVRERSQCNAPASVQRPRTVGDVVVVGTLDGIEARMEAVRGRRHVQDRDRVWEQAPELSMQSVGVQGRFRDQMSHLPSCMDPRIRSAGPDHADGLAKGGFQRRLQLPLDGSLARLDLPAVDIRSVVLDQEACGGHRHGKGIVHKFPHHGRLRFREFTAHVWTNLPALAFLTVPSLESRL